MRFEKVQPGANLFVMLHLLDLERLSSYRFGKRELLLEKKGVIE
jgi:hypothetical protein